VGGQLHAPTFLSPGKSRYLFYWRLSGFQDLSGRVRNISPPSGFDLGTVQPVAGSYTDCDILASIKLRLETDIPVLYLVDAGFLSQHGQRLYRLPHSLQNNDVAVPHVRPRPLPSIPFPIIYTTITSPVAAILNEWPDRRVSLHIKSQLRQEPCL